MSTTRFLFGKSMSRLPEQDAAAPPGGTGARGGTRGHAGHAGPGPHALTHINNYNIFEPSSPRSLRHWGGICASSGHHAHHAKTDPKLSNSICTKCCSKAWLASILVDTCLFLSASKGTKANEISASLLSCSRQYSLVVVMATCRGYRARRRPRLVSRVD
ncbi:unnamed protein product [Plutella xylostella]|uniref:(diamondback moth) hypothetical protein n=1 Tax=Plutella xylostella TaxID=51655 RepID=A0A8S4D5Z8_PLUXY|nr:unnamed protein product [Plutella xylostella]